MKGSWVVTGVGLVSAAGDSAEALFSALERGLPLASSHTAAPDAAAAGSAAPDARGAAPDDERGLSADTEPPPQPPGTAAPAIPIQDFDPKVYLKRKGLKDLSRTSQLACAAGSLVSPFVSGLEGGNLGVAFGSAWGSLKTIVDFERAAHVDGPRFVDPLLFTETVANVPAGQVSIVFGWSAFNGTLSAGTSSGLEAIRWAVDQLEEGRAEAAIAGGGDELNPPLLEALSAEGVTARSLPSSPFSQGRSGLVGGEGACFLAIEEEARSRARGAVPLARILSSASRFEAPFPDPHASPMRTGPSASPVLMVLIREMLAEARLGARQIDLLVLSANGGVMRDAAEALAVLEVFGEGPDAPPIVAPKGALGETWGASGPLGVVTCLEAMRRDLVPGRTRGGDLDATLARLNVPARAIRRPIETTLVLDCSETGHVSGLILEAL